MRQIHRQDRGPDFVGDGGRCEFVGIRQDHGEFFDLVRSLTVLGMFSSPKYGGNFAGAGWRLLGFEDRHVYAPPFGYYDRDYAGFESQTGKW